MATIKINGNMKLSALKARFFEELGVNIDVLTPDGQRADDGMTVGQLRDRKPKSTEVLVVGQSKVSTVEALFANDYGIRINVLNLDATEAPQTATIGSIQRQYAEDEPLPQDALAAIQHASQLNDWMEFWTFANKPVTLAGIPKRFRERAHEQMLIDGLRLASTFNGLYVFLYNGSEFAPGKRLLAAARDIAAKYDMAAMSASDLQCLARVAHDIFADQELALLAFDRGVERALAWVDFSILLEFSENTLHDAGRTRAVLDAAWSMNATLDFCLRMSSSVTKTLGDAALALQWYERAAPMITDWRCQYCAVGHAVHVLKNPQMAAKMFDAHTWLSSRGFTMDHGFPVYGNDPATMVLLSPEGAWNDDGDLREITQRYSLVDLMASDQNQSVTVLLRAGEYRGPVECLIAYSEIAAIGGREETIVAAGRASTIVVRHCGLDLYGLTVVRENDGKSHGSAVVLNGQGSIKIVNCSVISPDQHGIVVRGGFEAHTEITDSVVSGADIGLVAAGGEFIIRNCAFVDIGDAAIVKTDGVELDCNDVGDAVIRDSGLVDDVWLTSLAPEDSTTRDDRSDDEDDDDDEYDDDEDEDDDDDGVAADDDDDVEFWSSDNFSNGDGCQDEEGEDVAEVDEGDDEEECEDEDSEIPPFGKELAGDVVCIGLHIAAKLGDPLAKSDAIMRMLDRWRSASPALVLSGDALLHDCLASGRETFDAVGRVGESGLPDACIGRISAACWSAQIEYILGELTDALLPPPVIPTMAMAYACEIASELGVEMPMGLHRHYPKNTYGFSKTLAELVRAGVVFNLYDNVAIWGCDERDFDGWEVMPYRLVFNKHLFGIWFGGSLQAQPALLADFLNARLPEGWESHLFPDSGVRAAFGIFNSIVNVMLGVALDDKGGVVLLASDGARCSEYWLSNFGERDNARVVSEILHAVGLVGKWRQQDSTAADTAGAGAETTVDAAEMLAVLRIAIPTIPATFGSGG